MKSVGALELMRTVWVLVSDKPAQVLFLELEDLIENESDSLVIAEITANSFGTYIAKRKREIAGLIGGARR
jgi:hypothetical protein